MNAEFIVMLKDAAYMSLYLGAQLTVLFFLFSYFVGLIQQFLPPEKVKKLMGNERGYVIAALLAAITPFCSASTIPFLKSLFKSQVRFGNIMTFLIASPLLNPVVFGLLTLNFGLNTSVMFFLVALSVSVSAGYLLEKFGFADQVKDAVFDGREESVTCSRTCGSAVTKENLFIRVGKNAFYDFKKAFPYLMIGVAVGAFVYGFVPTEVITRVAGDHNPLAIPVAAFIGIPLYLTVESLIPLSSVLIAKGMSMGALLALIVGSAGASLTEVILLKSLFKNKLIAVFLLVVFTMAISTGLLYNLVA
ncbi:permease [Ferrimonas pelagia]|uniref:Permease n=1 Tax=Ferrimonas pelagia TaxID=1177826 RepID=A0ABP9E9N5_9GAMM